MIFLPYYIWEENNDSAKNNPLHAIKAPNYTVKSIFKKLCEYV